MMGYFRMYPLLACAVVFGVALSAYLYLHDRITQLFHSEKSTLSESCPDPSAQVTQQNPNKTLFISCGGFLE